MNPPPSIQQSPQLILVGPILHRPLHATILKFYGLDAVPQIAVDGGIRFALNPVAWVGDGDSGKGSTALPLVHKESQNQTDLSFALDYSREWKWEQLHLFGLLGKRKDHEWANLGEVCQELVKRGISSKAIFYDEESRPRIHVFSPGKHVLKINGLFSVLSFEKGAITIDGECDYSLNDEIIPAFSGRGISNRGKGMIQLQSSVPLILILVDEGLEKGNS